MRLTKECQKCNKFSHCNNNDLFCEKFITQELQTAKEEIIRLQSNDYFYVELDKKNELLTQQNKQMVEALEIITKKIHWIKKDPCLMKIKNCEKCTDKPCPINIAQRALKGGSR